ncbi:PstS family phosphate ABC transporter substrate-binding protein [Achromobacter insuavis]|uniref:PstS family phosphate ABC transporter substrate-binding protein n=1 Tax=Achromobacter insuavis TaxID=1287735 RepID=UPI001F12CB69|nr:substrate-binding domain-containing protein [Achromobacter insuavis]
MRARYFGIVAAGIAAFALAFGGDAAWARNVVSGGATLPWPLYQDAIGKLPGGMFLPYAGTGSSTGLQAFLLNTPAALDRSGAVHWVGSETPLTQAQIDDYLAQGLGRGGDPASHGPLIQIPAAYVPVTVAYKGPAEPVALNPTQLCAVFSGAISRWSQLGVAVPPSLDAFRLVFRAEGSGTTELLTRHLGAVCGNGGTPVFRGQALFADAFPPGGLPSHFAAAHGDGGVASAMAASVSAITYTGPDPVYTTGLKQAWLVNAHDGVAYLPTPANVIAAMESQGGKGLPTGPVVSRGPAGAGWSAPDNPANPANWVRVSSDPLHGYPIVGSTNFVLSQCYTDPAVTAAMRLFLKRHYEDIALVASRQLVPLPAPTRARLLATFVLGSGGAQLNIGNPALCGDLAGRG